jgi:sugar phosphate permease
MKSWDQVSGLHGWQWMFFLEAIPSVIIGVVVYFYLDDRITSAKWLKDEERDMLQKRIQEEESDKEHVPMMQVFKSGRMWTMSAIYFTMAMSLYGVSFWLPTIIKGMGVTDNFEIGMLSSLPWIASVFSMLLFARSADKMRERRWHVVVPMLMGSIGLILSVLLSGNTGLHGYRVCHSLVLELAHRVLGGCRCCCGYCRHQLHCQLGRLFGALFGGLAQATHLFHRFRHVHAGSRFGDWCCNYPYGSS